MPGGTVAEPLAVIPIREQQFDRALTLASRPALASSQLAGYAAYYKAVAQLRLSRPAEARETLAAEGVNARVVSAPSLEWFDEQDAAYREHVLPADVKARVSVEAGSALTWRGVVGDAGRSVAIDHLGASADYKTLFQKFGITADAVVEAARETIAAAAALDLAAAK